ncbi:MAG: hypothetical protein AAGG75_27700, partial [Bacteroidota bacterium]
TLALFTLAFLPGIEAGCVYALNLRGEVMEGGNMLSWSTQQETNNHFFVIERSYDGIHFEQAAKIEGAGNSKTTKQYRFLDITAGNSRTFYRLAQVDYDGTTAISHTVIVSLQDAQHIFAITAVNSAVTDRYFTMTLNVNVDDEMEYRVMTKMGDVKKKGSTPVVKGMNAMAIDLEKMEVGTYQLALKIRNEIEVMIIQKTDQKVAPDVNLVTKGDKK